MRYELEYLAYYGRQPRTLKIGGAILALVVMATSFSSNYDPLTSQLQHRYLEGQGRAPEQVAAKSEEERRRTEEQQREAQRQSIERQRQTEEQQRAAQKQQEAAQQRQLLQQSESDQHQQYLVALSRYRNATVTMRNNTLLQNIQIYQDDQKYDMRDRAFYRNNNVTIEETSSDRTCKNPGMFNSTQASYHNLFACFSYYSITASAAKTRPLSYQAVTIAVQRLGYDGERIPYFQLGRVIELSWAQTFDMELGGPLETIAAPELVAGEHYNPKLLGPWLALSFADLEIQTITDDERLNLRSQVYPILKEASDAYTALSGVCRQLKISPCMNPS